MARSNIVSVILVLIITTCLIACGNTAANNETNDAKELYDAFMSYALECKLADEIATERLNNTSGLLSNGEINTFEFRKRCYQIDLIHAYTLEYIDSKPEYAMLCPLLFGKDTPPKLGWCIPELESDPEGREVKYWSYLEDYIAAHHMGISIILNEIGPPEGE